MTSPVRVVVEAGSTKNPFTGFLITLTVVGPLTTPDAAPSVVSPCPLPVTTPAGSTVAIAGLSDAHEIATSVLGSPLKIRAEAINRSVPPTTNGAGTGSIRIVLIGAGLTITFVNWVFP